MKKVAIITPGVLPVPAVKGGGVETLLEVLLNENEKTPTIDFTVFTIDDKSSAKKQKLYRYAHFVNVKERPLLKAIVLKLNRYIYSINRRTIQNPRFTLQTPFCSHVLKEGQLSEFDAVLVESNFPILGVLKKAGAKKVLYHTHYNDVHPGLSKFELKKYRYGYADVDANISVSHFIQQKIQLALSPCPNCYVVENCVPHTVSPTEEDLKILAARYTIPLDKKILMYAGRITPEKGVTQLLNAYRSLKLCEDTCLVVAGGAYYSDNTDNEYIKNLKTIASQCTGQVVFTGYVPHEDMLMLWSLAHLAILPTYDVEDAAPLVVIEALAAGVPVVHTDSGGMTEYSSPDCAVVVPRGKEFEKRLAQKIEQLLSSTEVLNSMHQCAQKQAAKWSADQYFSKMSQVILAVTSK